MEDSLIKLYPFWLERTIRTLKKQQLKKLKQNNIDLTIEQWIVLLGVKNYEGATQKNISDNTLKDTANVKRIIDQLIKKGFVKRQEHSTDLRKTHLSMTEKGRKIILKVLPIMDSVRKKGLTDVSEKEFDYLVSTLKKIYHNLV
jgi:MarR family transcriptional regulator for hemolysin